MNRYVPIYKALLLFASTAGVLLVFGLIFYLAFGASLPAPLEHLHLKPLTLAGSVESGAPLGTLPSLIHVTVFGLLTWALLHPRLLSAFIAGAAWDNLNVFWELSAAIIKPGFASAAS
jgi:hypothetical protein